MMMTNDAHGLLAAFKDHGVDINPVSGYWDKFGWWQPGNPRGVLVHHTATASASEANPSPTLYWLLRAYNKPAANILVGKVPGHTFLASAGPAYHCGNGGPWPWAGIPAGNRPDMLFGIEIDDPGVSHSSINEYQVTNTARICAALWEFFGWSDERAIATHACWVSGCHGEKTDGPGPYAGRKNDTLDVPRFGDWPGSPDPTPYNAPWWRERVAEALGEGSQHWDGTVPGRAAVMRVHPEKGDKPGGRNKAAWRLRSRLVDLGYANEDHLDDKPPSTYPVAAMRRFREAQGWDGDGFSKAAQKRIFGTDKP